ncbi:MAG TPA: S26 family signal peptidase [Methanoregulaceae archaeon]|nr:S26 family signal peptidase [Methanothrix sp.]HOL44399.1 S26 family signal peptidase [Methanothrix sp.]HON93684.1 S26 family signal peptidase [Sedimentisphaerales bacterium]HPD11304.1 S26 family signal peptidase [Methanoregulaceae archaeon]HRT52164.1 S26 family signal peptidase [Anaerohalosphaeraceae bacterium]
MARALFQPFLKYLSDNRYRAVAVLSGTLLMVGLMAWVSQHYSVGYVPVHHRCLPYAAWIVEKGKIPPRYGYISFTTSGVPYIPDGTRWVKILNGLPGDRIETEVIPKEQRSKHLRTVMYNGLPKTLRLQGKLRLIRQDGRISEYEVFEYDTKGRPLPMITPGIIPPGHYFVSTTAPRSYDSRYWGLITETMIYGAAKPLI